MRFLLFFLSFISCCLCQAADLKDRVFVGIVSEYRASEKVIAEDFIDVEVTFDAEGRMHLPANFEGDYILSPDGDKWTLSLKQTQRIEATCQELPGLLIITVLGYEDGKMKGAAKYFLSLKK